MKYLNYTSHTIALPDGRRFLSDGLADIERIYCRLDGETFKERFGDVVGLPEPKLGVRIIVDPLVLEQSGRFDLVAPAIHHPDAKQTERTCYVPGLVTH